MNVSAIQTMIVRRRRLFVINAASQPRRQ